MESGRSPEVEDSYLCFQRTPSLRRKWRKRYGGLDGNKLLEPNGEADMREDGRTTDERPQSKTETQNAAPRPAPRSLIQHQVQGPVQKPISLVSPGSAGTTGGAASSVKPPLPQAEDRGPSPSRPGSPAQQRPSRRRAAANVLFDSFASDGRIDVSTFFEAVWSSGLHRADPRLRDCFLRLREVRDAGGSADRSSFSRSVSGSAPLVLRALQGRFVIPDFSTFTEETQRLFSRCRRLSPEQERETEGVDGSKWGVSVCTVDGQRFVSSRRSPEVTWGHLGSPECFPETVDVNAALDLMLQCSSTEVTCESGAVMAASLANGGLCPLSGDQVMSPAATRSLLSVMQVAGMKDYSSTFLHKTSVPAVSSSRGSLLAVVPGVLGLVAVSPELDACGNPWRAVHLCQELISRFQLHSFDVRTPFRQSLTYRQWKTESEGHQLMNVLLAAFRGDVQSLRRYFLSGVDVNAIDYDGRSALHVAAAEGHVEVIRFLLENAGANPALKDRWGSSALHEAQRHNKDSAVQLLQEVA